MAGQYQFASGIHVALGYANLLASPSKSNLKTWSDEHRIYQQLTYTSRISKVGLFYRLRNEQRWREQIDVNADKWNGSYVFTNRIRYLMSMNFPLSKSKNKSALVLADEVFVQLGPSIIYNTFDQNRLFIGYKQNVSKSISFDIGYMRVFQQKSSGNQYDLNHTIRLFFYGNFKANRTSSAI